MLKPIKLNKEMLRDKIYACWLGKNIGGTMGGPFEGTEKFLDITGYTTPKGEPLPNDDLDLQLLWLHAMQRAGASTFDENILAEYWLTYITPHWNEYGIAKANIREGMMPPLCGEADNDKWKHSNGAWIRSEIWACLAPGLPNLAVKYAIMDASIDHGMGEGSYAEVFTAALESIAFFETDIRVIIEKGLSYIPENCRVAQCVRKVIEEYDKGTPYREVREMLIEMTKDLGWFQSPANLGYVTIGLLYGEGDFKKSMIATINCGDDTDCTGATIGSILGILKGSAGIPSDWAEYIGDRIVTICINATYRWQVPKTCTALTTEVLHSIPGVLFANGIYLEYTDGENEMDKEWAVDYCYPHGKNPSDFFKRSPYSFNQKNNVLGDITIEFEGKPKVKPNEKITFKCTVVNGLGESYNSEVKMFLPEGWSAEYDQMVFIDRETRHTSPYAVFNVTLTAGEKVYAKNEMVFQISSSARAITRTVPVVIYG